MSTDLHCNVSKVVVLIMTTDYIGTSFSGHYLQGSLPLMRPRIYVTTTVIAVSSPSHQRPPVSRGNSFLAYRVALSEGDYCTVPSWFSPNLHLHNISFLPSLSTSNIVRTFPGRLDTAVRKPSRYTVELVVQLSRVTLSDTLPRLQGVPP